MASRSKAILRRYYRLLGTPEESLLHLDGVWKVEPRWITHSFTGRLGWSSQPSNLGGIPVLLVEDFKIEVVVVP